jgi:hypothetical protein
MRISRLVVAALILGGVVLGGCGGDDGAGTVSRLGTPPMGADPAGSATGEMSARETAQEIAVVLEDWSVAPELGEMDAGVVEFVVTNGGSEPHKLVVIESAGAHRDAALGASPI